MKALSNSKGENSYNWLRSGIIDVTSSIWNSSKAGLGFVDPSSNWTSITDGLFAVYRIVAYDDFSAPEDLLRYQVAFNEEGKFKDGQGENFDRYKRTPSVDIVFTKDTALWSRCPVVEMCEYDTIQEKTDGLIDGVKFIAGPSEGGANKFRLRRQRSVYRDGSAMPLSKIESFNVSDHTFLPDSGMGWFPGYVIDVETGERLNVFFGEDSRWGAFNGRDMIWNPSDKEFTDLYAATGGARGELVLGAKHNIYVSGHSYEDTTGVSVLGSKNKNCSVSYDGGERIYANLKLSDVDSIYAPNGEPFNVSSSKKLAALEAVYNNVVFTGRPMLENQFINFDKETDPYGFIVSDLTVKIRMANPYRGRGALKSNGSIYYKTNFLKHDTLALNDNAPMFRFSTVGLGATKNNQDVAEDALDLINVVPNPYYAYNSYELKQTQKLVKFTNLPNECTISIYNIGGNLVRKFDKSSPLSYLDWDLNNEYGIEIAGGIYIIHINVPGVGEKVLKWFGSLRPVDLEQI